MKYIAIITSEFVLLICIIWAFNLHDPHLFQIRVYEAYLILALLIFAFSFTRKLRNTYLKKAQIGVIVVVAFYVLISETQLYLVKRQILHSPSDAEKIINQRMIVGFNDFSELEILAKNGIAGIFLTKRNIVNMTKSELKARIDNLQKLRLQHGLSPLFITTDQEGGPVSRLTPLIERQPPLSKLAMTKNSASMAFEYGKRQGQQLHEIGVNVNFSPVVDLMPSQESGALDFNTMIKSRAISDNPMKVSVIAVAYIKGLNSTGVTATLKHFPGLLRVKEDTHYFSAHLDTDIDILEKFDWIPFVHATKNTKTWMMLSHVILTSVDDKNPVSTSQTVVNEIIRKKLQFKGILITDDMTMGAINNQGFCKSVIASYNSDIDYLLIAYNYEMYFDAIHCIANHTRGTAN
jgi:beta-N-acetylhexosaminidase